MNKQVLRILEIHLSCLSTHLNKDTIMVYNNAETKKKVFHETTETYTINDKVRTSFREPIKI